MSAAEKGMVAPYEYRHAERAEGSKLHLMPLTDDQRKALEPLFNQVRAAAGLGKPRAIFAQVWHDAAVLKVLNPEEVQHVQKVLGGDGEISCSGADRMAAAGVKLS